MTRRLPFVAALLALYAVLVTFANQRHLWHDELYTFYIAQAPTLKELWKDLQLDMNPPLLYLLSRVSMGLLGKTAFAVRLPCTLAFFGGSLCLFELVRRRFQSSPYGALTVLVFWVTPAFYFATEARPYGLILGFFGLAMLAWWRGDCTWVLTIAVAGMMLSHFFAILFLSPFLLAEAVRFRETRGVNWPNLTALLTPCVLPFFFLHLNAGTAFPDAFRAGFRKMASYYYWALYEEIWVLLLGLCGAIIVYLVLTKQRPVWPHYSKVEKAFAAGLFALPFLVNAVIMLMHGAFFTRYSVPTLFIIPIAFVVLLGAWTHNNRVAALAVCSLMAVYALKHELKPAPKHSDFAQIHADLPLVAASGLTFLEMDHDEPPATVSRLYYLTDRDLALKYAHATLFEGLPVIKQNLPIRGHVEPFTAFTQTHRQFLVLGTPNYAEDWLLRYLLANQAKVELLGDFPSEYKDPQLYLVSL